MIKRYSEYRGSNTTMGCLAKECKDGEWIKYEDYLKEKVSILHKPPTLSAVWCIIKKDRGYLDEDRVLVYSPGASLDMKYRCIDSQFVDILTDATHWMKLYEPNGI